MSLINDALKKAQKQRTGESTPLAAMPGIGGESASRIAKRAKPVGFNSMLLRLGLGAGAVLVLGLGGYFAFRAKPAPSAVGTQPSASSSQLPAPSSQPTPPQTAPATQTQQPITKNPEPAAPSAAGFTLPVVTPPPPTPEPVVVKKPTGAAVTPPQKPSVSNSQPSALNSQPAVAQPSPKLEPRAINFIENLKIAGIRASATDSKVLMNDRVYRVGDIVEHEMGLKLIGITANSLTFEDERGGRYTRQF